MEEILLKCIGAVYLGVEKEGDTWLGRLAGELTICGEGNLKLTNKGIYFNRWLPPKEFFIPLDRISKVELGMTHLLKPIFPGKVLRIFYQENSGERLIFGVWMGAHEGQKWKEKTERQLSETKRTVNNS